MQRYLVIRLAQGVFVFWGIAIIVFFMIRLTGDPAVVMMPQEATAEQIAEFRHKMGYDRPLIVQFLDFAGGILVGDFGKSIHWNQPAFRLIAERLRPTLELAVAGIILAVGLAVPLGIISASRPGSIWDVLAQGVALLGQSLPTYWVGLVLILILAVRLGLLPATGRVGWRSLIMPAVTISMGSMGRLTRLTRSAMLEVLQQDYIRTAYGKGLHPRTVYVRHALRNAAIPVLTYAGVAFGYMLGGSVLIETVFAWPGVGRLAYQAVSVRDFPLVQAVALFMSVVIVVLNLVVDLAYALINPEVRY